MSRVGIIEELTDICVRQAGIIKAQAFVIEQLGARRLWKTRLLPPVYRRSSAT